MFFFERYSFFIRSIRYSARLCSHIFLPTTTWVSAKEIFFYCSIAYTRNQSGHDAPSGLMMKRPELLMFALLRSSATALATTGEKIYLPQQAQIIQLRLATRIDVPAIQRCNLACLPENYNSQFYCSHLRQWPDLALVAEEIPCHDGSAGSPQNSQPRNPFAGFPHHHEPKIVAYLLGKVETRPVMDYNEPTSQRDLGVETLGHVTSLAVQKDYRRLGLAKAMMTQLHHHLQHQGVDTCGLHVRTSNIAACRLYEDDDYQVGKEKRPIYRCRRECNNVRPSGLTSFLLNAACRLKV